MKAVVLAGGKGTRLAPYTQILPKPLMPIGNLPILEVLVRQMKHAGVDEIIITVGHLAELLRSYFKDGSRYGVRITYSMEEQPLGTAGPLSLLEGLEGTFLVTNGDVLTTLQMADLVAYHQAQKAAATIAMHTRQVKIDFGVLQVDGGNRVTGYIEKPAYDYAVSMGIYAFDSRVLTHIPYNQYLDFPDLVLKLLAAGEKVLGYPYAGYWQDLGRPDDYARANQDFDAMRSQFLPEDK
jgi:NDP-sugar pyrophosphorylase family protein